MKTVKKIIAVIAIVVTVLSIAVPVSAANACSEISGKTTVENGKTTTFYVKTQNTKKHSVTMKMTQGYMCSDCQSFWPNKTMYDYYTITVYGVTGNKTKQLSSVNVKNKSSYTINFSGYTKYKIKIKSWNATDIVSDAGLYYGIFSRALNTNYCQTHGVGWRTNSGYKVPTWKISKTKGVTYCY